MCKKTHFMIKKPIKNYSCTGKCSGFIITHTTSRRFWKPVYEIDYVLPCETDYTTTTVPDVFSEKITIVFIDEVDRGGG